MDRKRKLTTFEKFNKNYPNMLRAITSFSKVIFTFLKTFLTTVALPIALFLLIIVEVIRIENGISLFEETKSIALFGAIAIVFLNIVFEFMITYVERVEDFIHNTEYDASLKLFFRNAMYRLGLGKDFVAREASPAKSFKVMQKLITFTIVVLALSGSMHQEIIEQGDEMWHTALVNIVLYSNLETIMSWMSGLLFTIAAVFSSQRLAQYIALEAFEAENEIKLKAKQATLKEQGIVQLPLEQAKIKMTELKQFENFDVGDKVQFRPTLKFFDSRTNTWRGEYKRRGSFIKMLGDINEERESVVS